MSAGYVRAFATFAPSRTGARLKNPTVQETAVPRNNATFDELFRGHLRDVYEALDVQVPEILDDFIVAHPMVWTFTRPLVSIRHTDQVPIRTNCPGRLTYEVDDVPAEAMNLVAVGGVMAGTRRFQITLGPFPASVQRLAFCFYCEHPGCKHEAPCCLSGPQEIRFGGTRLATAAVSSV